MDIRENKKGDTESKPEAGARDPKKKHAKLNEHPVKGRETENETSLEKVRVEQGEKNYRGNTN